MRLFIGLLLSAAALFAQTPEPINNSLRARWAVYSTVGPPNLAGGVVSSAWGTLFNRPEEYGPHWAGFGKRYGMRLTGSATSNVMEAGLGAIWGEDPRYHRTGSDQAFGRRVQGAIRQAFWAHDRNGNSMPAYARYIAIPGSNFLSNTWRADSESQASDALLRTGLGFAARITSNIFTEFWPDIRRR